jgi:cytochrome c1
MVMKHLSLVVVAATLLLNSCAALNDKEVEAFEIAGGNWRNGRDKIQYYGCGSCHTIPGVPGAQGLTGPPLTKFAHRMYIGGVLANTPENLQTWIRDPKAVDKLTAMPRLFVTDSDARDIATYLYTLQ